MSINPDFRAALLASLPAGAPAPDDVQLAQMYAWYQAVVETNQHFNLTRITDPAEAAVKHFADSLAVLAWTASGEKGVRSLSHEPRAAHPGDAVPTSSTGLEAKAPDPFFRGARVLDIGTGAGFPAAPLAIMRPDWTVTAIDSTGKKARFVSETAARLGISNLTAHHARAGQWQSPARFDLVLFKAVGAMSDCLVDACNLVLPGGCAIHFKTSEVTEEEESSARAAATKHGFKALPAHEYTLSLGEARMERCLRVFRK